MRIDNWEQVLADYLTASQTLQFEWGKNDCALWASSFVDMVTGQAIAEGWRGFYDSEAGANALMLERGFANCEAIADYHLQQKPLKMASRGDLVLHPCGALGICDGRRSYFLSPDRGFSAMLTIQCKKAWEV